MRTVSIVGARPQFVKLAPVSRAMAAAKEASGASIEDIIVHTGQHYDSGMSDVFFDELEIPRPDVHLNVGSASHAVQTARMLESIEAVLVERSPDLVIIYGDTNSTVAGALAAAKLNFPVAHVEAGLRSFDRSMPEEVNRIVADHVSDLLFAPTETAMVNLHNENLSPRSMLTGDVMLDAVRFNAALAEHKSEILAELDIKERGYAVATLHRASNTQPDALIQALDVFNQIASELLPVVFPAHPRTIAVLKTNSSTWRAAPNLKLIEPVGYLDMLKLLGNARLAMTDSGGLQKEALFLGTPCVTLRDETEWPETVDAGMNILTGIDQERIIQAVRRWLERHPGSNVDLSDQNSPFGDGDAASAIVREVLSRA